MLKKKGSAGAGTVATGESRFMFVLGAIACSTQGVLLQTLHLRVISSSEKYESLENQYELSGCKACAQPVELSLTGQADNFKADKSVPECPTFINLCPPSLAADPSFRLLV